MKRDLGIRLERLADGFASVSFGGAVGVFVYHLPAPVAVQPLHGAYAAAAALAAYGISRSLLGLVGKRLPTLAKAGSARWDESGSVDSPLVVRLFDPVEATASGRSTARTGGQAMDLPSDSPADASQSLHEALNQLRQSLANRR